MQEVPRMTTLSDETCPGVDAYLLLSFELAGHTTILDVRGTSFRAISLPGLDLSSHTLLLQRMPDQSLLQVTSKVGSLQSKDLLAGKDWLFQFSGLRLNLTEGTYYQESGSSQLGIILTKSTSQAFLMS